MYDNTKAEQIWILLIIIGIIIGSLCGFLYGKNKANKVTCAPCPKNTTAVKSTPAPKKTTSESNIDLETETYTDKEYGFSLEYPESDWQINSTDDFVTGVGDNTILTLISDDVLAEMETSGENSKKGSAPNFQIMKYNDLSDIPNADNFTNIKEYLDSDKMIFSNVAEYKLDDIDCWQTTVVGLYDYFRIYVKYNSKIYILEFGQSNSFDNLSDTEKNILKSFKFI